MTFPERPRPLRDAAKEASLAVGLGGSIITALVGYGILTVAQGDAFTALLGLLPGVVTGITAVAAAFRTANNGEQRVTPIESPLSAAGEPLVPAHGRHERLN